MYRPSSPCAVLRRVLCPLASLSLLLTTATSLPAQVYTVESVPFIQGAEAAFAAGIDRSPLGTINVVVGHFNMTGGAKRAFRYNVNDQQLRVLNPLPGDSSSEAHGGSYIGWACGKSDHRIVRWFNDGPAERLDNDGLTQSADAVNRLGQITGTRTVGLGEAQAYLWTANDGFTMLGTLGGTNSGGSAINRDGVIVGGSDRAGAGFEGFRWENGNMIGLGTISGFPNSWAICISDNGVIGVVASNLFPPGSQSFLWENGQQEVLPKLPNLTTHGQVNDVNNNRQAVGHCAAGFTSRACLWYDGKVYDLNDLIAPNSGWELWTATGITDSGLICGYGSRNNRTEAFILRPNYANGAVLVNNVEEKKGYVLDPRSGHFLGTFDASYAGRGIQFIDGQGFGQSGSLLLSDREQGLVHALAADGSRLRAFTRQRAPDVRGIARSVGGYFVGVDQDGFVAWDSSGNRVPETVPGNFMDIIMVQFGSRRFYVMTDHDNQNVHGYTLDLEFYGQTRRGGIPGPLQVAALYSDQYYGIASFTNSRVYGLHTSNGSPAGSFPTDGRAIGIIQLGNNQMMVSTTTGIHLYNPQGQYVRTVLSRPGFQYLSRCANFKGY